MIRHIRVCDRCGEDCNPKLNGDEDGRSSALRVVVNQAIKPLRLALFPDSGEVKTTLKGVSAEEFPDLCGDCIDVVAKALTKIFKVQDTRVQDVCDTCDGDGWCENYHGNGDVNRRWRCPDCNAKEA